MGFWPTWNRYNAATKSGGFPTFVSTLNSFIDIIHATENKAFKEGTTSVNSNYKSSHVASNPRGGGGYSGFQVTGMIEWSQKPRPKKIPRASSKTQKIPGPKN